MSHSRSLGALAPVLVLAVSIAAPAQDRMVNAPVAPEAIYLGRTGDVRGISVIDLNGFGQGTGDPADTRFPLNPNVGQPGVVPPLAPGTSRLDAGSAGALTLVRDSTASALLHRAGIVDLALGAPLDLVYNNSSINRNAIDSNQVNPATRRPQPGNTISVAPHPNPPRLVLPPPNPRLGILAEEPTVTSSQGAAGRILTQSPPCLPSPVNLLVPGDPFSTINPGLLGANYSGVFYGPQPPPPSPPPPTPFCPFTSRQQVGHFLYTLDVERGEVTVLNSNLFTVLARIALPDPTSLAMAPSLRWLAVCNARPGTVSLIDTDPASDRFNQVVVTIAVGRGARGLAWQPEGEDLLVTNELDDSLSIIDGATLRVRKVVSRFLKRPREVAVTLRMFGVGWNTWTWFAFILNGDGTVAVYESGPDFIGLDDVMGIPEGLHFADARAIQPDLAGLVPAGWITHRDGAGLGQVSHVARVRGPQGPRWNWHRGRDLRGPVFRGNRFAVDARYGGLDATTPVRDLFSGNDVVDLAFDDIINRGAFPDLPSILRPWLPQAGHSGKGQAKLTWSGIAPAHEPHLLFVACRDVGKVDVIDLATGRRLRTLDAPGTASLCHHWRQ